MMNRLRGDRVLVDLTPKEETKDAYEQTGGLFIPKEETKKFALRSGVIKKVGHKVNTQDLKEGLTVYVKDFQGERLYPDELIYLFNERDIVGND